MKSKLKTLFSNNSLEDLSKSDLKNIKWRFASEISNIGIWDFRADADKVYFSKESKNIIGVDDDDFGSDPQDWNNRVHPDDLDKYYQDFKDHLDGLTPIYENEHRVLCEDGSYKWILDKGKIFDRNSEGEPIRIIGTHIDITAQKENELAISKSLELINNQNEKLKSFAHIVTHNLKSHSGNFESLLEFYDDAKTSEEKADLIEHLKTVTQSLSKTISNLHDIVSIRSDKDFGVKSINIYKYIINTISLFEVEIKESKAMINNEVFNDLHIEFNPAYFESIVQNLLSNALKYKHPERTPVINIKSIVKDDEIKLIIADNGIGIDLDKYGKDVFGLYRTFHKNEDSEGVGLYLTKSHIEASNGTIEVDSNLDLGTTFTITIPHKKNPA